MEIRVDQKSLSKWKERFGGVIDEAISLGEKIFAQYEDICGKTIDITFISNVAGAKLPESAKLHVSYRIPEYKDGLLLAPMIFFSATVS